MIYIYVKARNLQRYIILSLTAVSCISCWSCRTLSISLRLPTVMFSVSKATGNFLTLSSLLNGVLKVMGVCRGLLNTDPKQKPSGLTALSVSLILLHQESSNNCVKVNVASFLSRKPQYSSYQSQEYFIKACKFLALKQRTILASCPLSPLSAKNNV